VCSRVPERLGVNPFCILCSIKLLAVRKEYMALRRQDVNTFSAWNAFQCDGSEIGWDIRIAFSMDQYCAGFFPFGRNGSR
jgi:hypothetical protein